MQVTRLQLHDLAEEMARIPAVARGGCCVLTSMMLDALAQLGIEGTAVAYDSWKDSLDIDEDGSFGHVCVKLTLDGEELTWDDQGLRPFNQFGKYDGILYRVEGEMSREQVRKRAANRRVWNKAFDRDGQMPRMRRIIRTHLSLPDTVPLGPET